MGIRIRHQGGALAGEVLEFDDEVSVVRFGRDSTRCQVVYPPDTPSVSREHFALERRPGYWCLVTNRQQPVLVEGREAHDGQRLEFPCELTVGTNGPKLLVEDDSEEALPSTQGERSEQPGTHTRIETVRVHTAHNRRVAQLAIALVGVSALALWLGVDRLRGRTAVVEAAVLEESSRSSELRRDVELKWEALAKAKRTFLDVAREAEKSVYNVQVRESETIHHRVGTAWAAGPGVLVTNAHVAEAFDQVGPGALIVRASTPPHDALRIERISIHPGYARWAAMVYQYEPPEALIQACDVALLHVVSEDAARLAPALPIATFAQVEGLSSGTPMASLGFPGEGMVGGGSDVLRPKATLQVGYATAITDFFFRNAGGPERAQLVQHNLPVAGGASGGPILDQEGRVVAVNCAGNFAMMRDVRDQDVRVPVGGINFGQRADLARELLEADVASRQDARDEQWRTSFQELWVREADFRWRKVEDAFRGWLSSSGAPSVEITTLAEEELQLTERGLSGARQVRMRLPRSGWFLAAALPQQAIDVDLFLMQGNSVLAKDDRPDNLALAPATGRAGDEYLIQVVEAGEPVGPVDVTLRIYFAAAD